MTDSYRDDLEAMIRRADELERANAALTTRNAELQAGAPPATKAVVKRQSAGAVLFATGVIAVVLLFAISPIAGGVGFIVLVGIPFALLMLRAMKWLDKNGVR